MTRVVTIEPVTRIEGSARVTIALGEDGRVRDARVHVTQVRGFEALCVGRLVRELPALTARICGICPVSHALAAARAGDVLLGADPPPAARRLRELVQLASVVQSHALSFFLLSAPDLLEPPPPPSRRNLLALAEDAPGLVRDGVALRSFGQRVIAEVAGQRVHPAFAVPGGVARPLEARVRDALAAEVPGALSVARRTLESWWERLVRLPAELGPADPGGVSLALAGDGGALAFAEGRLRAVSAAGAVVVDGLDPARHAEVLAEAVEPWTYVRLASWRTPGEGTGTYRVGPLARLSVAARCGTPLADAALARLRAAPGALRSPFAAHLARLVELLHALERIGALLADPELLGREVLASPGDGREEGVGACEAPRGLLLHRYRADRDGVVREANLLVPTGQNARAMNAAVRLAAERWLAGGRLDEAALGHVEAVLRAFDPCLSCATHALGAPGVAVRLVGARGEVLDEAPGERRAHGGRGTPPPCPSRAGSPTS